MPFNVYPTTAEIIISSVDVVLLFKNGANIDQVVTFLDITRDTAQNALRMAEQLSILRHDSSTDLYSNNSLLSKYLVTSFEKQKAAFLRLFLEEYEPYVFFKRRLCLTKQIDLSAEQTKTYFGLAAHREEIKSTFVNLGTYTSSLFSEGAGLFKVEEFDSTTYLNTNFIASLISTREEAKMSLDIYLDDDVIKFVSDANCIDNLVTALIGLNNKDDTRNPIVHSGNAVESFLQLIADRESISLVGANGINAKADRLKQAGKMSTKHYNISKYIGHIRNAADHGIDADIAAEWTISSESARMYVNVCIAFLKNYFQHFKSNFII